SHPVESSHPVDSYAVSSYGRPGSGGRQPITYVGDRPHRHSNVKGRRPVIAILDTGCGQHDWLDDVVDKDVTLDGKPIGYTDPKTDPERLGDLVGPLDGGIDPLSGHGTFIAGLVHQTCPDADIVSWRIVKSSGPLVESDWMHALTKIVELVRRYYEGDRGGRPIDVLNLSMGYYHETPQDRLFSPSLRHLLGLLGKCGTTVVCSAGNDATARPQFPAAFAPWKPARRRSRPRKDRVPVISVGALNPNLTSIALFSNTGPWVRAYEPGASVVSTMPPLQGGLEPMARTRAFGHEREAIDPDNFRRGKDDTGGFAVWSGTSFAAPVMAGKIARELVGQLPKKRADDSKAAAVARGWKAVAEVTDIRQ
ncbi:MAG: S8/S53 family peptidase, partial [Nocardioidaceae bacterium]